MSTVRNRDKTQKDRIFTQQEIINFLAHKRKEYLWAKENNLHAAAKAFLDSARQTREKFNIKELPSVQLTLF